MKDIISFFFFKKIGAVQYLHQNGIAHRDLKIENLMFESPDKDVLKVGDFGLAKQIGTQATKTPCGTKEYMVNFHQFFF